MVEFSDLVFKFYAILWQWLLSANDDGNHRRKGQMLPHGSNGASRKKSLTAFSLKSFDSMQIVNRVPLETTFSYAIAYYKTNILR